MLDNKEKIIKACKDKWEANKTDCNKFVRAVGAEIGITIAQGNADSIIQSLTAPKWKSAANGVVAKEKADEGLFVIAGLKAADHDPPRTNGHVAVVVSGPLAHGKYPTGYWGSIGGAAAQNTTLNHSWNTADRDNIEYYYYA